MFIELIDSLRCVRPHEDTWLVAGVDALRGRHIVAGTLGCHVCGARYAIREGVAHFERDAPYIAERPPDDAERAVRLAALLGLGEGGGIVVLDGAWGADAPALIALLAADGRVPPSLLALDPPADAGELDDVSVVRTDGAIPLAAASARAFALDGAREGPALRAADAARVLGTGGRLLAPAACPVPADVRELARDGAMWVGERLSAPSTPVGLARAR